MLYLSQFVFQSILFSKKKEHAGDSWHPPVPGGEGAVVLPPMASAALTSPSPAAPPPHRAAGCPGPRRELEPVSHFHLLWEEKLGLLVPLQKAPPRCPFLFLAGPQCTRLG